MQPPPPNLCSDQLAFGEVQLSTVPSELKQQYGITRAPTLLFVNAEGSHKAYDGAGYAQQTWPTGRHSSLPTCSAAALLLPRPCQNAHSVLAALRAATAGESKAPAIVSWIKQQAGLGDKGGEGMRSAAEEERPRASNRQEGRRRGQAEPEAGKAKAAPEAPQATPWVLEKATLSQLGSALEADAVVLLAFLAGPSPTCSQRLEDLNREVFGLHRLVKGVQASPGGVERRWCSRRCRFLPPTLASAHGSSCPQPLSPLPPPPGEPDRCGGCGDGQGALWREPAGGRRGRLLAPGARPPLG